MNLSQVSLFLVLLCFLSTFTAGSNSPTHFTGDVSINCGSTGTLAALDGRQWLGDGQPELSSLLQLKGLSASSTVIHKLNSGDPVPHKTARLSRSQFSYAFQVNPGQKIIRLHFNPTLYKGFKELKDLFTVEAGPFTLLSNFSASQTADALAVNTFAKEFCLNVQENQQFNIVFSPESCQSLDTYAFVNGIEIISVPAGLSYFYGGDMGIPVVGQKPLVYVDNSTALEIINRIYVTKDFVSSTDDSSDMFGEWATIPKQEVNNFKNITWEMSVDVGFRYLVRLHFSKVDGLSFKVLINEIVVNTNTDIVVKERDDRSLPWYEDYVVMMNDYKQEGKCSLLICQQSNERSMDGHGPLKGFEILKLSNPDGSLAGPNPLPPAQDSPSQTIQTFLLILVRRNAIATIAITIISLVNIIVYELRGIQEARGSEEDKPSVLAERITNAIPTISRTIIPLVTIVYKLQGIWEACSSDKPPVRVKGTCRRFSLAEIKSATNKFKVGLLIGSGGFGNVYKGQIDKGETAVAVKRLIPNSRQGEHEFQTEIETLSEVRHDNLVSLIGYCSERGEMILVYEYMACGTLADRLYKLGRDGNNPASSLTWKQRIRICIGAAQGLDYLHTGRKIIHRDVKPHNILLDEHFVAKVSDFGLAKHLNRCESHVTTTVKGTPGYCDPYYLEHNMLTFKSDTYAFGVVLLQVLCGRPAVDKWALREERTLTRWAQDKIDKGEVKQIVDSNLTEEISKASLKAFVEVAVRCLDEKPENRPTMSEVVQELKLALEQQESNQDLVLKSSAAPSDESEQSRFQSLPSYPSTMGDALITVILTQVAIITELQIRQGVSVVCGVENEISRLRSGLEFIKVVLADAEKRQVKEKSVKNWLEKLRDVSYDTDDVLSEWIAATQKAEIEGNGSQYSPTKKVCSFFNISCLGCNRVALRRDIALKIKKINGRLENIATEKYRYMFNESTSSECVDRPKSASFIDVSQVEGRDVDNFDKQTIV